MIAYITTVDLVIQAQSWAEACDALSSLLFEIGMCEGPEPSLHDWSYVPGQKGHESWPKRIDLPDDWRRLPDGERDVSKLFADRGHVEEMLVMNNAHLYPAARKALHCGEGVIIPYNYGWIVHTRIDAGEALRPLQSFARLRGCLWIKFDRDGPVFDQLPTFEW